MCKHKLLRRKRQCPRQQLRRGQTASPSLSPLRATCLPARLRPSPSPALWIPPTPTFSETALDCYPFLLLPFAICPSKSDPSINFLNVQVSLMKRNTSTQVLTFHFLPVPSLLFTAKLHERASLHSVYPHFISHPILSHHTTKCLSPRHQLSSCG